MNTKILKYQKFFKWLFLSLSFLLVSAEVEGARKFFIALAWSFIAFSVTHERICNPILRNTIRIAAIVILAPSAVTFILAGSDAVMTQLASPFANECIDSAQNSYREGCKVYTTITNFWDIGNIRLNGNFNWFYFVLVVSLACSVVMFIWSFGWKANTYTAIITACVICLWKVNMAMGWILAVVCVIAGFSILLFYELRSVVLEYT